MARLISEFASWATLCEDGRLMCRLCPRYCKLGPDQRGFCFVRRRRGDRIELATYGRTSGFAVDPVEKKPLNHFFPGTAVLSFGTAGCNLGCRFCQNWDISKAQSLDRLAEPASPEQIARAAVRLDCRSVAFTYNDPVIFAEYAIDTARACHAAGVRAIAVTAGYITPEARGPFFAVMDAANIDLKGFTESFYHRLCFAQLQPVLDTLAYVHRQTEVWLEVTTLLIPGENDSDAEIDRMSDWFAATLGRDVPWHFTAYHPDFKLHAPPTPVETLERARDIAVRKGIRFVYVGNAPTTEGATTRCPGCGEPLIRRVGYRIEHYALRRGCCPTCGRRIPGHFDADSGGWTGQCARVCVG